DGIRDPLVTGVQTCALPIWVPQGARDTRGRRAGASPRAHLDTASCDGCARLLGTLPHHVARRGARAARARGLPRRLAGVARLITSRENEKLKLVRKLHDRSWRDKLGLFVAEGEDLVEAASA